MKKEKQKNTNTKIERKRKSVSETSTYCEDNIQKMIGLIKSLIEGYPSTIEESLQKKIEDLKIEDLENAVAQQGQREKANNTPDRTKMRLLRLGKKGRRIDYPCFPGFLNKFLNKEKSLPNDLKIYGISLRILITQMRRVKWFFHFTRNNPNHTKRFYFRLKTIVGLEDWPRVSPDVRQAWEDASNRFDMQYGLVRAWIMTPWVLEPGSKSEIPNEKPQWMNSLIDGIENQKKAVEALTNMLNKTPKDLQDKLEAMNQATQEAQKTAEDALKTLNAYYAISNANQNTKEESNS